MSRSPVRYAWLSVAAAVITIALKAGAYYLTGSVGLLSDALESFVNLAGALMALSMLTVAARPPDEDHAFGHGKAEYFSSGVEGALILVAAISIAIAAIERLFNPRELEQVGSGIAVSLVASLINLFVALSIRRASRRYESVTLDANARHLFTDVWTSAGVIAGVAVVGLTGWKALDPILALLVAANIVREGWIIVRGSISGLMDAAIDEGELQAVERVLEDHAATVFQYHALRTRRAGTRRFVSVHILVPGDWSVHRGHELSEEIEKNICAVVPNCSILTHLESLDDPASWDDIALDRQANQ
ncbi:cation transporter [bacterium]|nr:cation transporter [bacterium]